MKILKPSEFKAQNSAAKLEDYISYLEGIQTEIEETYDNAKSLSLNEKTLNEIENNLKEIYQILSFIEKQLGIIIFHAIDKLSLEELQSYFEDKEKEDARKEQQTELEKKKKEIEAALEQINTKIEDNLWKHGKSKDFYEEKDANIFFQASLTPVELLGNLLSNVYSKPLIDDMKSAIEIESRIQNIELSSEELETITSKILIQLKKCAKILEYSPTAKEEIAQKLLSETGLILCFPDKFLKQTIEYIAYHLMSFAKQRTSFYENLPILIQKALINERFVGEVYQSLEQTYVAIQQGKEIPIDDFNAQEYLEQQQLKEELANIELKLACLNSEKEADTQFMSDIEAMRSVLKNALQKKIGNDGIALDDINQAIDATEKNKRELEETLISAASELAQTENSLMKAKAILEDPNYDNFFYMVNLNNARRLYHILGYNVTEDLVKPFLIEEERRYEQIKIMISTQQALEQLYKRICDTKYNSNIISRQFSHYKETIRKLEISYSRKKESGFELLQKQSLFQIYPPIIDIEATNAEKVVLLPRKNVEKEPKSFEELQGLKQEFWNLSTGIWEETQGKVLGMHPEFPDWNLYGKFLMSKQKELVNKLFNFSTDEDGYFHFTITEKERDELLEIQKAIIEVGRLTYKDRREFRIKLGSYSPSDYDYTSEEAKELKSILGKGSDLSRRTLINYIGEAEIRITDLKKLLASHQTVCKNLGIIVPETGFTKDNSDDLECHIKSLHIEGVTTLKDAISYRELLAGLEEYVVPEETVKQFYLKHHIQVK